MTRKGKEFGGREGNHDGRLSIYNFFNFFTTQIYSYITFELK